MPAAPRRLRPTRRPAALAPAALLVAAMLAGCMTEEGPDAALRAARADSAAAGYSVVDSDAERAAAMELDPTAPLEWLRRRFAGAGRADSSADSSAAPVVAMASRTPVAPPSRTRPAAVRPAVVATAIDSGAPDGTRARVADDPPPPIEDRALPDSLLPVGDFLVYNPARRTVRILAVAGHDGANGSLNFNGAFRGSRVVVVPLGWLVEVDFRQDDESLAHSALVATEQQPMPVDAPPPAFPGAATSRTREGVIEGGAEAFAFTADRAGRYVLQCGVPGHAQAGMWLWLRVDSLATAPRLR